MNAEVVKKEREAKIREATINALLKIQNYLETVIIPQIKYKDGVSVEFGEMRKSEYAHSLTVRSDGHICFKTGDLILRFKPDVCDSVFESWTYCKDLVLCWQDVKYKLTAELQKQEKEYLALVDFQV